MYQNEKIMKILAWKAIFIYDLDEKTVQSGILSNGWHLISFKNFYCYVLLKF